MWNLYNLRCRVDRMHPNNKNTLCCNCLKYGHPTNVWMQNTKVTWYGFCMEKHFHTNHKCASSGCSEKAPYHHTVKVCVHCNSKGDYYYLDPKCPRWLKYNLPCA